MDNTSYDLVIIGGGPIGIACGIEAQKKDLKYVILEKGVLVNALYNFPENMTFFSTSELLEIGEVPFVSDRDKPTRKESLEYYRRVQETYNLNISLYTEVLKMTPKEEGYTIVTGKGDAFAKAVIVATGFYDTPRELKIPGANLPKVKYFYDSPHPYVGQKIVIIGAANSACDVALETYYKGAEVTMVVRGAGINERTKYWIKPNIENRIKEGAIAAHFNSQVTSISKENVTVNTLNGEIVIENDFVLAMIGYKPNYTLFKNIGLPIDDDEFRTPIFNEETLETPLPNVFIAGVAAGGLKTSRFFIENTRIHAEMILNHLEKKLKK
ncbi:YpdA family putative bacillithiol disulfide reductase [Dokdonia sp. Hel_I_53]|uniref:YpdA family putative bacillithiol disulfide reductase n=1 Tax=Dokdonia sp. Hel_I_53 TaxID=1566287 RepID=UPI0016488C78|nr:YpdA family putative bacillithiol disulfide reductase [Dokdonia sp. Hel_I_53]